MQELNKKIIEWAKDRNIDKKGTVEGQAIKTIEEMSELIKGICKDDIDLIKDSIGDVYVTLVIGCMLSGVDIETRIDFENETTFKINNKFEILYNLSKDIQVIISNYFDKNVYNDFTFAFYLTLKRIAKYYNTNLKECVELAYNEIANRKGKMVDGQFVKESDLK